MKISVLTDNHAGHVTKAEHGLSYLIEYDNKKILFDTGQSNLFLENAGVMKTDTGNIDMVVLSHGHYDHGNGLEYLPYSTLLCHPGCFIKRYHKSDNEYIGLKSSYDVLTAKFNLITSSQPYQISDHIIFLGEIPRLTDFESQVTPFILEDGKPDFVRDDSALALIMPEGLFIITGCGHSGVVNVCEYARKITGISKIYGIMGGFHLKKEGRQLTETINYLKAKGVSHVLPSHCNDLPALSAFYLNFGSKQVMTGDIFGF